MVGRPTTLGGDDLYGQWQPFSYAHQPTACRSGHVTIDFISQQLPLRIQHALNAALMGLLAVPVFGAISNVAVRKALRAFSTGSGPGRRLPGRSCGLLHDDGHRHVPAHPSGRCNSPTGPLQGDPQS